MAEPITDREYFERILLEMNRRMDERTVAAKEAVTTAMSSADSATKAAFAASETATTKAFDAASALAQGHNDLLRKMERLIDTFATKAEVNERFGRLERFQAMIGGATLLAGFIGIANLVKVWG